MGLFKSRTAGRATEPQAPTAVAQDGEIEKGKEVWHSEDGRTNSLTDHIDPAIEKRVVRKLDRNIVPLVMALCKQDPMSCHL